MGLRRSAYWRIVRGIHEGLDSLGGDTNLHDIPDGVVDGEPPTNASWIGSKPGVLAGAGKLALEWSLDGHQPPEDQLTFYYGWLGPFGTVVATDTNANRPLTRGPEVNAEFLRALMALASASGLDNRP